MMLNSTVATRSAGPVSGTPVAFCTPFAQVEEKLPHEHGESSAVFMCCNSAADSVEVSVVLLYDYVRESHEPDWDYTESWFHSALSCIGSPTSTLCQAELLYLFKSTFTGCVHYIHYIPVRVLCAVRGHKDTCLLFKNYLSAENKNATP